MSNNLQARIKEINELLKRVGTPRGIGGAHELDDFSPAYIQMILPRDLVGKLKEYLDEHYTSYSGHMVSPRIIEISSLDNGKMHISIDFLPYDSVSSNRRVEASNAALLASKKVIQNFLLRK